MPAKYRNVSIKQELADFIEKLLKSNPHFGYRSLTQFFEAVGRRQLEEWDVLPKPVVMTHYNLDENGVKILDYSLNGHGRIVDVYFTPEGVRCEYDNSNNCRHVKFALSVPAIQKVVRKKREEGWNLPDPDLRR